MTYQHIKVPAGGKITIANGKLNVPDNPIIPFIEGDGTGPDIWRASQRVLDAAVQKAYGGGRKLVWMEVYAGEKCFNQFNTWLLDETVDAFKEYLVGIKGPLTTPIGGGIRSLNVALRKLLDLYACVRPVRWFNGVPSPVKRPQDVDMIIFRENTEDIYTGIDLEEGSPDNVRFKQFLKEHFPKELGDPLCARQQTQERDVRAQGQHHEVHRGRVPQLGLRGDRTRVWRPRVYVGTVGAHEER